MGCFDEGEGVVKGRGCGLFLVFERLCFAGGVFDGKGQAGVLCEQCLGVGEGAF